MTGEIGDHGNDRVPGSEAGAGAQAGGGTAEEAAELDRVLATMPVLKMPSDVWTRIDSTLESLPPPATAPAAPQPDDVPAASNGEVVPLHRPRWDRPALRLAVAAVAALVAVGVLSTVTEVAPEDPPVVAAARSVPAVDDMGSAPAEASAGAPGTFADAESAPPGDGGSGDTEAPSALPGVPPSLAAELAANPVAEIPSSEAAAVGVTGARVWTASGPFAPGTVVSRDGMTLTFPPPQGASAGPADTTSAVVGFTSGVRVMRIAVTAGDRTWLYAGEADGTVVIAPSTAGHSPADPITQVTVYYDLLM